MVRETGGVVRKTGRGSVERTCVQVLSRVATVVFRATRGGLPAVRCNKHSPSSLFQRRQTSVNAGGDGSDVIRPGACRHLSRRGPTSGRWGTPSGRTCGRRCGSRTWRLPHSRAPPCGRAGSGFAWSRVRRSCTRTWQGRKRAGERQGAGSVTQQHPWAQASKSHERNVIHGTVGNRLYSLTTVAQGRKYVFFNEINFTVKYTSLKYVACWALLCAWCAGLFIFVLLHSTRM